MLWGGGRNGKDMAKLLISKGQKFSWVCDNNNKIGKNIYDVKINPTEYILELNEPQIMIVVASPTAEKEIREQLLKMKKEKVKDYWFFL